MDGVLLVQLYDVPVPEKFIWLVSEPLHTTWLEGCVTVGIGLTVTVTLFEHESLMAVVS
jgi:hypothetical protein